jgi:hypothetical protein
MDQDFLDKNKRAYEIGKRALDINKEANEQYASALNELYLCHYAEAAVMATTAAMLYSAIRLHDQAREVKMNVLVPVSKRIDKELSDFAKENGIVVGDKNKEMLIGEHSETYARIGEIVDRMVPE